MYPIVAGIMMHCSDLTCCRIRFKYVFQHIGIYGVFSSLFTLLSLIFLSSLFTLRHFTSPAYHTPLRSLIFLTCLISFLLSFVGICSYSKNNSTFSHNFICTEKRACQFCESREGLSRLSTAKCEDEKKSYNMMLRGEKTVVRFDRSL